MIYKKPPKATYCVVWLLFGLSIPIYVIWTVVNYDHLCSWAEKFCDFLIKFKR